MRKRFLTLGLCICVTFVSLSAGTVEASFFRNFFKKNRRPLPNIAEFVISENERTGEFTTLLTAVLTVTEDPNTPDLVDALSNADLTVFAPTDEAFSNINLDPNVVAGLDPGFLADVLLYHVTPGKKRAIPLLFERDVEMLNGDFTEVSLNFRPFGIYVNDSRVIKPNLRASNGIVHVIDEVLLPPTDPAPEPPPLITSNIPEPTSFALCMGFIGLLGLRRRVVA